MDLRTSPPEVCQGCGSWGVNPRGATGVIPAGERDRQPTAQASTTQSTQQATMMETTQQETNFSSEAIPASDFQIPAGYKQVPLGMDKMQSRQGTGKRLPAAANSHQPNKM